MQHAEHTNRSRSGDVVELVYAPYSDTPVGPVGVWCKDGGTCHHDCTPNPKSPDRGCFRQECASPLSISGLNDAWETLEEVAQKEKMILGRAVSKKCKKSGKVSRL